MVQSSPRAGTPRIVRLFVFPTRVCGEHCMQRARIHTTCKGVQHLGPGDFAERLEFCRWLNDSGELHRYILFTDETLFNRDGFNITHN